MSDARPDHAQVEKLLAAAQAPYSASESHGIQCGLACVGRDDWRSLLLEGAGEGDLLAQEAAEALQAWWRTTSSELVQRAMPIHLLLPDDERPVAERARALRDWSRGFLYGFGLGGAREAALFSTEAGEALRDFTEISRMDLEAFDDDETAREALMQLEEYLWVALSLIWHEVNDRDAQ